MINSQVQSGAMLAAIMVAVALAGAVTLLVLDRLHDTDVRAGLFLIALLIGTAVAMVAADWRRSPRA